nr:PREDICTED: olfactory receptor 6N1-like [Lepisosteus oculatus]
MSLFVLPPDVTQLADSNTTVSQLTEFLLLGGELGHNEFYTELSIILLVVYLLVLMGNLTILTLVVADHRLHTPMYILLSNLSFIDIVITTTVIPKMISVCIKNDMAISISGCFLQMYFYLSLQSVESFLLTVMAYDRYVAICKPLHYNTIVTNGVCALLAVTAWILGLCGASIAVILATQLPFCNNQVFFWFCDYPPVVRLACMDTTFLLDLALGLALVIIYFPFTVIVWSYSKIILSVFRIGSSDGHLKAFSTCSSHLIVVLTFYLAHSCVYISVKFQNVPQRAIMVISIVNCFLTPLVNPIVYSFRNKEIKRALRKHFPRKRTFP